MDRLRAELKEWENGFKRDHSRAPTRQDIKDDPAIAAKYKQYNASKSTTTKVIKTPVKTKPQKKKLAKPQDAVVPSIAHASPPKAKIVVANSPLKLKKLVQDLSSPRKAARQQQLTLDDPFSGPSSSATPESRRNPFALSPKKDSPNTKFMRDLLEQADKEEREARKNKTGGPSWDELFRADAAKPSFASSVTSNAAPSATAKGKDKALADRGMEDAFGPSPEKPDAKVFRALVDDSPVKQPAAFASVVGKRSADEGHGKAPAKKSKGAFGAPKKKLVNAAVGEKKVTSLHVPEPRILDVLADDSQDEDDDDDVSMHGSPSPNKKQKKRKKEQIVIRQRLDPIHQHDDSPPPTSLLFTRSRQADTESEPEEENEGLPDAMAGLLSLSPTKARLRQEQVKKGELVKRLLGEPSAIRKRKGLADLKDDNDQEEEVVSEGDEDWASESDGWCRVEGELDDW